MKTSLVKIGNSKGVRLPKAVIEQAQLSDELELEVGDGVIVLRAIRAVRKDWQQEAASCRAASEDVLADWDAVSGDFDGEWR
ncbi:MAG: AbrB/MazE/SpoVT family DNA-binding domain-containing protein [Pirellulales bacterium]